ncbi:MAG: SDR family NAD(P)-dependent oxidoreductase [Rhodoferax sp.]|nr:SDR family NAD(P)-dependent oxidoreductase [Rhodoferax sp.]
MSNYLITGATSGLGRQVAKRLARQGGNHLVLPCRDASRGEQLRKELSAFGATEVSVPTLDLASLASVAAFTREFSKRNTMQLDGVLLNAGGQSAHVMEATVDGIEASFAVNHLAHFLLLKGLMPVLASRSIVGWTASATHDPNERAAKMSGFRGAQYTTAARLAKGDYGNASESQACKDAYATSKLCNIVMAHALANTQPELASFFSFDPGLMPGTGLARKHGAGAQWVWRHVLPRLAAVLPGASSTEKSSAILTDLLTGRLRGSYNGAYFNYTAKQLEPAAPAKERWVADDLLATSTALTSAYC